MSMSLASIDRIALNISGNHKQRIIVSAHIQAVTLTDGKELGSIVRAYDLTPRIGFETGFPDMLAARSVGLGYELD